MTRGLNFQRERTRIKNPVNQPDTAADDAHPLARWIIPAGALACAAPLISPPLALAFGMILALTLHNPYAGASRRVAKWLLQGSVVALGFSMNLDMVVRAGLHGFGLAAATIIGTWGLGSVLGRLIGVHAKTANLVCVGTAICGGSAIAAVGSVTDSGEAEMSVALGTVFLLNAVALFVFPVLGHMLGLTQEQFGTWAGIAIHDISSVVGASAHYGDRALQVATAVKLSRALWIVPVSMVAAWRYHRNGVKRKVAGKADAPRRPIQVPWFIGLFLVASLVRTLSPMVADAAPLITAGAGRALTLTLFLIGAGMARHTLREVGPRPMLMGALLWISISVGSLLVVKQW